MSFYTPTTNGIISLSRKEAVMSSRSFTKEEQAILKENRYTYNVSANTISFTIEFKKEFWKRYQSGERPKDIVEALGYDYSLLGRNQSIWAKGHDQKASP